MSKKTMRNIADLTISKELQEQLKALRRIAIIESVGSSTRMAGAKLSNREVEQLLFGLSSQTLASLPKLAEQILALVRERQKITIAEVIETTQAPRSTIKKYLAMLVDQKYLMRHGRGRNVWYTVL